MWRKLKKQLEKIQNSDETTKKRWLIGVTAFSMILIIAFWLVYINWIININITSENHESSIESWQIFKTGLFVAINSIKESIKDFISKISNERTIIIEKP